MPPPPGRQASKLQLKLEWTSSAQGWLNVTFMAEWRLNPAVRVEESSPVEGTCELVCEGERISASNGQGKGPPGRRKSMSKLRVCVWNGQVVRRGVRLPI